MVLDWSRPNGDGIWYAMVVFIEMMTKTLFEHIKVNAGSGMAG